MRYSVMREDKGDEDGSRKWLLFALSIGAILGLLIGVPVGIFNGWAAGLNAGLIAAVIAWFFIGGLEAALGVFAKWLENGQ